MKQVARNKGEASRGRADDRSRAAPHVADGARSCFVHLIDRTTDVSIADVVGHEIDSSGPVDDFTYLDIGSVDREKKIFAEPKLVPLVEAPSRAKQKVEAGDVLVSMTRPNLNAVAPVTQELHGSIASTGFHVLRSPWLQPGFLYYLVQTDDFVDAMCGVVQGALYPAVRPRDIESFKFTLPPRAEQTRIVEKLEELLSDLDAGVAELKAAQRKLAQYRQSLLKAAVEGALTADWRAAHMQTGKPQETGTELLQRILTERRTRWEASQLAKFAEQGKTPLKGWQAKYKEPEAPVDTVGLMYPFGWVTTGFEQIADGLPHSLKAGPFGSALKKEFYVPSGYKIYGQEQVIRGDSSYGDYFISVEKFEQLSSCEVKPGDVLISLVGTTGKVLVLPDDAEPGIINPRLLKISVTRNHVDPHFVKVFLESPITRTFFKGESHGGTMEILNLGILKQLPIPLPPIDEQKAIVEVLSAQLDELDSQDEAITRGLRFSVAQRKNILKAAFAGQLVPQDPNDEPASALLERIRAERVSSTAKRSGKAGRNPRKKA